MNTEPNTTSIDAMVAEIRRQASQRNATWTGIMLSDMLQLCAELDTLRRTDRDAFRASSEIRGKEIERLRALVSELEQDAQRYRWLRSIDAQASVHWHDDSADDGLIRELLDPAIDAAMAKDGA